MRLLLACSTIILISGCAWFSKNKSAIVSSVGKTADIAQTVFNAGTTFILSRATSGEDLNAKANLLDSAAGGLRSLDTKSGGLSTQLIAGVLEQFTDPTKTHWSDFAESVAEAIIKDPAPDSVKLEKAAMAANDLAASQRAALNAVSADTATAPQP